MYAVRAPAAVVGRCSCSSDPVGGARGMRLYRSNAKATATPAFCSQQHPAAECVVTDNGRFAVAFGKPLSSAAHTVGVSLTGDLQGSLRRIAQLLPGPRTDIFIYAGTRVIPGQALAELLTPAPAR